MTTITLTITSTPDAIDFNIEHIFCESDLLRCWNTLLENTKKAEQIITDKIKEISETGGLTIG